MNPLLMASADVAGLPLLPALVVLPFLGALAVALVPRSRPDVVRQVAVLAALLEGALAIWVLSQFHAEEAGFQLVTTQPWIPAAGISFSLGIDGISLWLVVLTGLLWPIALLATQPEHDAKGYHAWLLLLQGGCMGVFLALDLFLFFVMFEIVLVPMYLLIGGWGHGRSVYAATKFFLYTMAGSALMLVGLVALAVLAQAGPDDSVTFNLVALADSPYVTQEAARWIFVAFAAAFAIKVPIFPLHTWLPDAHTEAPTAGSVILAGVMLKLGTYGFVRLGVYLLPEAAVWAAPVLVVLGVVGILYGAVAATMQKDLKRLVAYSSVAHLGFIVIGIFSLTIVGLEGGILQMVNHGISTGALFLLVGFLYERRHTREISALRGLQSVAPVMAGVFLLVTFSSIGLPGLNGFVGEFLTLLGTWTAYPVAGGAAALGVILAALYLLWAFQRVFHGTPTDTDVAETPDLRARELLVLAPLLVMIVGFGLFPKPLLERMEPSVEALVAHVEEKVPAFEAPDTEDGAEVDLDKAVAAAEAHGEGAEGEAGHGGDQEHGSDGGGE